MAQKLQRRSKWRALLERLRRWRKPETPEDPYAYHMAPVKTGPKGRSGAAVAELEENSSS